MNNMQLQIIKINEELSLLDECLKRQKYYFMAKLTNRYVLMSGMVCSFWAGTILAKKVNKTNVLFSTLAFSSYLASKLFNNKIFKNFINKILTLKT